MPMSFEYIQPDVLLPLFYAEVTSAPEPISPSLKLCLIGHMNRGAVYDEGSGLENTLYILTRTAATDLFGPGSQLEAMYEKARYNAPTAEIWGIACPEDPVDSIRSVGSIQVMHPANALRLGIATMYIAGRKLDINIRAGDTAEAIAKRFQDKINKSRFPVRATGATGLPGSDTITITAKWAGLTGNQIDLTFVGPHGRETANDPGVRMVRWYLELTQPSGGEGEPEAPTTFAAIGDRPFDIFCMAIPGPGAGLGALDAAQDFMDNAAGRWSPTQQLYGHMVCTREDSFANLFAMAETRNDPHMTVLGVQNSIMPPWEWSAALAGVMITHWAAPPELSRPLQTLELRGMYVGADDDSSFDAVERQLLLEQGISTFHVDRDTTCRIDRIRTLRKLNLYGDPDPSWADAITMFQAQYLVRAMRAAITGAFPRAALTTEDSGIPGFASPGMIKMVIIHEYKRLQRLGLVENANYFSQYLIVERDDVDRNRVNVLMRPDMVNQLRVVAVIVETHLELDPTSPLLSVGIAA